jgi:hypothetical protein
MPHAVGAAHPIPQQGIERGLCGQRISFARSDHQICDLTRMEFADARISATHNFSFSRNNPFSFLALTHRRKHMPSEQNQMRQFCM